ncbi:hypothetical protein SAMN05421636_1311 [Pricia antarctica]|uniref:Uncharacterized protein n=1 Tax=Pricia antarctica TaxID=641691 RepID=A0A1G7JJJ5_9FLAO|nr:hypothetical protein [Pricia antarctica]SDF25101.1 hypothetical protein SAMN05421636_1311 [Pricia antarctica]
MKRRNSIFLIIVFVIYASCSEKNPEYLILGKKSLDKENYSLARNQFLTIKSDNLDYDKAQEYIKKIDSIEKVILKKSILKDSIAKIESNKLRKKYAGTYKIEVSGTSSKEQVEVYILNTDGKAEWLWINYGKSKTGITDDRKSGDWIADTNSITISIKGNSGMISETYQEKNGSLINKQLSKRRLERTKEIFK